MSAISPGPWRQDVPVWNIIRDRDGNEVAEVIGDEPDNARLITAAWEMGVIFESMVDHDSAALAEYPEIRVIVAQLRKGRP